MWCLLLIVLPIALVFSESSMNNLQSVSIISAFPIGIIIILIIISFFKDSKLYMKQLSEGTAWTVEELSTIENPVEQKHYIRDAVNKLKGKIIIRKKEND